MKTSGRTAIARAALPPMLKMGMFVLVAGCGMDLLYHTLPLAWFGPLGTAFGPEGLIAHAVTVGGGLISLAAMFHRPSARPRRATSAAPLRKGGEVTAHG